MVRVRVEGVGLDSTHGPVVVLKEVDGERVLPIWIGHHEAQAIQMKLEGHEYGRPLTHDLMRNLLDGLKAKLVRVDITELKDATYYAELVLETPAGEVKVDARPSDSIALALRCEAPLYAHESLFRLAGVGQSTEEAEAEEESDDEKEARRRAELQRRLRDTDPGEFGHYKLGS
jgi:hypothetical protein